MSQLNTAVTVLLNSRIFGVWSCGFGWTEIRLRSKGYPRTWGKRLGLEGPSRCFTRRDVYLLKGVSYNSLRLAQ